MNRADIEHEIIKILLQDNKAITLYFLHPKWFSIGDYKTIVHLLLKHKGNFPNLMDLFAKCKQENERFAMSFSDFLNLSQEVVVASNMTYYINALHKVTLREELQDLQVAYSRCPSDDLEEEMKDILVKIDQIGHDQTTGDLSDTWDSMLYQLDHKSEQGIKTFSRLDAVLGGGLFAGNLVVIGARPAVGKSAWTLNLLEKAMERNDGLRVDFFSLEMTKQEILRRFISLKTGLNSNRLKRMNELLTPQEKVQVKETIETYRERDIQVFQETYLEDIVRIIKNRVADHKGTYLVAIDYLGLIKIRTRWRDRRLEIEEITRELKTLAAELNIPIVLLSQLSRGVEMRQDKRPTLSDLRESGSIEQDANVVGFLYWDDKTADKYPNGLQREMELLIRKNRDGSLMDIHFDFFPQKMLFEENYTRQ